MTWEVWQGQPTMASSCTAEQIAESLLADAGFRALKLGTWLTPDGELVAAAVTAMAPPPYQEDADLLIRALRLAVQAQQVEARRKFLAGAAVGGVLALAIGSSGS